MDTNDTITFSWKGKFVSSGSKNITFTVDNANELIEINENNNTLTKNIVIGDVAEESLETGPFIIKGRLVDRLFGTPLSNYNSEVINNKDAWAVTQSGKSNSSGYFNFNVDNYETGYLLHFSNKDGYNAAGVVGDLDESNNWKFHTGTEISTINGFVLSSSSSMEIKRFLCGAPPPAYTIFWFKTSSSITTDNSTLIGGTSPTL